jgi:hypothetical protein
MTAALLQKLGFATSAGRRSIAWTALLLGVGSYILAEGVEQWRRVAFVSDTRASRSPTPFGTRFVQWRPTISTGGRHPQWFIATIGTEDSSSICRFVESAFARSVRDRKIVWLQASTATSARSVDYECPVLDSQGRRWATPVISRPLAALRPGAATIQSEGFVVLDSTLSVVYGSRRLEDLSRLSAILDLYDVLGASDGTR